MAKKSLIRRNKKRLDISRRLSEKRDALKSQANNRDAPFKERMEAFLKLSEAKRDGSKVRIRARCNITGRSRGNLRKFGVSRIVLRELASWGQIPGLIKSSW